MYQKVCVSPRPPTTIYYKDNWMCDLDSDVARSSNDTQRIQPKPKTQLSSTGRPVCGQESTKEIEKHTMFDHDTLRQEKHDDITDSTSTKKPVCGSESTKRCMLTPTHVEEDQKSTGRPVLVDQKEEREIDFTEFQDCHMQLCRKQNISEFNQELVHRIENHLHRAAFHADLQQNNVYNPFSKNSKEMIRELGNVELFELCETTPKVQCSQRLLY